VYRIAISLVLATVALAVAARAQAPDPQNTLVIEVKTGRVLIRLRPDLAPRHVERAKVLARQGFYNGLKFHRVIDGFMAQTGDPKGDGTGGSGVNLPAEFSKEPFERGTVGAARSQNPNSADSQFFICFAPSTWLNGQYTVWGKVVQGMEFVDKLKKGDRASNGLVNSPDRIVKLQVAADAKK